MNEQPTDPNPIPSLPLPEPTLLQRAIAWVILIALIGLGAILLATSLVVGGIVVLIVAAIVGARMLWRKITGGGGGGSQGRQNVRVIERR